MGNHRVGQMFNIGTSIFSKEEINKMTIEKAMNVIESIGIKVINSTSLDAEFDDYTDFDQPLGAMLIKAFYPEKFSEWAWKLDLSDETQDLWWDKVYEPFKNKFGFW